VPFYAFSLWLNLCTILGYAKGGNVTSAEWQATLCDPMWHVSFLSGEVCCELLYSVYLYIFYSGRIYNVRRSSGDSDLISVCLSVCPSVRQVIFSK